MDVAVVDVAKMAATVGVELATRLPLPSEVMTMSRPIVESVSDGNDTDEVAVSVPTVRRPAVVDER